MQVRITIKEKPVDYGKKLVLGKEQSKCRVWNIRFSTKGKKGAEMKIYRTKFEHITIVFDHNEENNKTARNYCVENGYDMISQGFKGTFGGCKDHNVYIIKAQRKTRDKNQKGDLIKEKDIVKVPASGDSMLPKDAVEKYEKYLIHMLNEKGSVNGKLPPLHTRADKAVNL